MNVSRCCQWPPARGEERWWAFGCNVDVCGTLGLSCGARGSSDIRDTPPPMCGGVLVISRVYVCVFHCWSLQVVAKLVSTSGMLLKLMISRALGMKPTNILLKSVHCSASLQAGCAVTLRLLVGFLWTSAPANAGLGLAFLIGRATGTTKRFVPDSSLGQS